MIEGTGDLLRTRAQPHKMLAMSKLVRLTALVCLLFTLATGQAAVPSEQAKPPAEPAKIRIAVSPDRVPVGGSAEVTLQLAPKAGIKINRYPKIKLVVPEQPGLTKQAEAAIGNDRPPPPGKIEANYYDTVDPVTLRIELDREVSRGVHEFDGRLVYYYCVKKSGFCAPARVNVKIPVQVE
jgi:hypothetical protein